METKPRLHPLLTAAAISVTVFSAVGAATLTGLVPSSIGSQKGEMPFEIPQESAKAIEPAITQPVQKKKVARAVPIPKVSTPVAYNEYTVEAPKPVVQPGHLATVQAVREVKERGEHTGLGPIAGGIAGAVLGAAGGAYAGREIERQARATTHWEVDLRRDDGATQTVRYEVAPPYQPGERVRLVEGRLQPA